MNFLPFTAVVVVVAAGIRYATATAGRRAQRRWGRICGYRYSKDGGISAWGPCDRAPGHFGNHEVTIHLRRGGTRCLVFGNGWGFVKWDHSTDSGE